MHTSTACNPIEPYTTSPLAPYGEGGDGRNEERTPVHGGDGNENISSKALGDAASLKKK